MNSRPHILRVAGIAAILFGSWLLLSGKLDAMHVGMGALAACVIGYLSARRQATRVPRYFRLALFAPWLFYQIVISNLRVALLVFAPKNRLRPRIVTVPPQTRGEGPLSLLGCSITLTPGTVSVEIDETELKVHALDEVSAREIEEADMDMRVHRLFEDGER